jgi:hypothetical protein
MGPEDAISGILKEHREQVLAQIANLGSEMVVCEEKPFGWDLEEGDDIEPEDHWYVGDLSGKVLPDDLVPEARTEELKFVDKIKLWEVEPRPAGVRVIPTRRVDVNKGDEADYSARSRLVAQEIQCEGAVQQYFAAMPPLAALKLMFSLAVTVILPAIARIYAKKTRYVMQFLDVKKAHLGDGRKDLARRIAMGVQAAPRIEG